MSVLNELAKSEKVDVSKILGLLLVRCDDFKLEEIGRQIVEGEFNKRLSEIPVLTALKIYSDCNLGKETYTKQRRI